MRQRAVAGCMLLLLAAATAAHAVTISTTNKGADDMPWAPFSEDQKSKSGYYEPIGQAPIAVAHGLQLPCGNKFLMMVGGDHAVIMQWQMSHAMHGS